MEWTKEKCLDLVAAYESQEILWNTKHRHYFNKAKRQDAWEEIAATLGFDGEECRKKMAVMTASMRREKAKLKKSIKIGLNPDEVYCSSWYAFDRMKFLYDKDLPEEIRNSIGNKETTFAETIIEQATDNEDAPTTTIRDSCSAPSEKEIASESNPHSSSDISAASTTAITTSRKRKREELPRRPDMTSYGLQNECEASPRSFYDEELQDFGNFIAKKLRKYNELTRSYIQNEITAIFLNADRGCYSHILTNSGAVTLMPNVVDGELVLPNDAEVDTKCFRRRSSVINGDYDDQIHSQHLL